MTAILHYLDGSAREVQISQASDAIELSAWTLDDRDQKFLQRLRIAPVDEPLACPVIYRFALEGFKDGYPHYRETK